MPRRCGLGCTPTRGVLHVFPNPDKFPEQFKAWVRVVSGQDECNFNYRNMRICDRHFTEKDRNRYNRLNALAVPSLFLREQPSNTCGLLNSTSEQTFNQPEVSDNYHQLSSGKIYEKEMEKSSLDIPEVSDIQQSTSVPSNWSSLSSNSPSSFTEECGLNKDMSKEESTSTLFCVCCLRSEIPYINLSTCSHGDFLNSFVMSVMQLKDQVVCYQCHSTLKKIKLFKVQIEKNFKILADSVVKIAKSSQESSNLQTSQLFTIHISSKLYKRKPQTKKGEDPQSKRKKADIDKDNLIPEEMSKTNISEKPQTITEHARTSVEKCSLPVIDRKTKNIEHALKIIKINQNSGCINLLASSLQTISYSLLGKIYNTNSDISNQLSIPKDISRSINMANNAALITNENLKTNTDLKIENQVSENMNTLTTPTIPVSNKNISMNNTIESNRIAIDDNILIEETDIVESATNEALNPIERDKSLNGGQSDMQMDKPVVNYPTLGSNIRQLTLTREQLMEERSKISSSKTYLQLPHRCETCLVGFQFRENLDDHINRKHIGKRIQNPKQCDVCRQFMEAYDYDKHLNSHLIRYECVACAQQFASHDKAAQHYKKRHRVTNARAVFKCTRCPYKTLHKCRLKRHMRCVTKCKMCGVIISHGCATENTLKRRIA